MLPHAPSRAGAEGLYRLSTVLEKRRVHIGPRFGEPALWYEGRGGVEIIWSAVQRICLDGDGGLVAMLVLLAYTLIDLDDMAHQFKYMWIELAPPGSQVPHTVAPPSGTSMGSIQGTGTHNLRPSLRHAVR